MCLRRRGHRRCIQRGFVLLLRVVFLCVRGAVSTSGRRVTDVVHRGVDRAKLIAAELSGARDGMRRRRLRPARRIGHIGRRGILLEHGFQLTLRASPDARALAHLRDVRLVQHRETRVRDPLVTGGCSQATPDVTDRTVVVPRRSSSTPRILDANGKSRKFEFQARSSHNICDIHGQIDTVN